MNEAKKVALVGVLQNEIGLGADDVREILAAVAAKAVGATAAPTPADEIPAVLATTGERVLIQPGDDVTPRPQAARLHEFAATISKLGPELRGGSGWRSRKLWVALTTLAGMMAQLPAGVVLPPVTQLIIGGVAAIYITTQGCLDAQTKPRPVEPAA
jgi:hypothetical protein